MKTTLPNTCDCELAEYEAKGSGLWHQHPDWPPPELLLRRHAAKIRREVLIADFALVGGVDVLVGGRRQASSGHF